MTIVQWENPIRFMTNAAWWLPWHARVSLKMLKGREVGGWFRQLGSMPSLSAIDSCGRYLVDCGVPDAYIQLALPVVLRDIRHDNPDLAIKGMRYLVNETLGYHGTETIVLRALAYLIDPATDYSLVEIADDEFLTIGGDPCV